VAGTEGSGFWFELLVRGVKAAEFASLDNKVGAIIKFSDNTVHSSFAEGMRFYLNGYSPTSPQRFENLKFLRNRFKGLDIHRTENIIVSGSTFSDSSIGT
jgi:hypothetical protein